MKLVELITYFRNNGSYEDFCDSQSLDINAEVVEIYMQRPFDLANDLAFFEIEKTHGKLEHLFNGISYFNLFDFYYFLDSIEESKNKESQKITDNELAIKLLSYAANNA